jgi:hypothetical protein
VNWSSGPVRQRQKTSPSFSSARSTRSPLRKVPFFDPASSR